MLVVLYVVLVINATHHSASILIETEIANSRDYNPDAPKAEIELLKKVWDSRCEEYYPV